MKVRKMRCQKNVEIHYNDEARFDLAKSLNKRRQEIEKLEQEKKDVSKDYREKIKATQQELARELRIVEQGRETVVGAQCEMELDEENKVTRFFYDGKIVEEREATEEDARLFNSTLFPEQEPGVEIPDPLADIDDDELLGAGSTPEDIAEVRKLEVKRGNKKR